MNNKTSRRQFLTRAALGAGAVAFAGCQSPTKPMARRSPNSKLNIGMVGTANQARYNLDNVASENIVAICDIDERLLNAAAEKFPQAKKFMDFRKMLELREIDAVVVATPDHTHAVATVAALKSGRDVYCEKPLTHTISECRIVTDLARRQKAVTQIGTQIHAGNNYRRVVELIQSNAIGSVREVFVWVYASYPKRVQKTDTTPVPAGVNYDLWLGPVEHRPYHPDYLPFNWRHYWAFGGGSLADFGCHYLDLPHWALGIRRPISAEVLDSPPLDAETTPPWLIVKYFYENPKGGQPLPLTWHHGAGKQPALLSEKQKDAWKSGVLFVGDKGMLLADYNRHQLLPEDQFRDFKAPAPFIPNSIGHHKEWIEACKTRGPTTCSFDYSGPLTEAALLGNVAYRLGKKVDWDWKKMKARNLPEADKLIQHHYRPGWAL